METKFYYVKQGNEYVKVHALAYIIDLRNPEKSLVQDTEGTLRFVDSCELLEKIPEESASENTPEPMEDLIDALLKFVPKPKDEAAKKLFKDFLNKLK